MAKNQFFLIIKHTPSILIIRHMEMLITGVSSPLLITVEVRSGAEGFMIKMRDGTYLRCAHNNPQRGHLSDYATHPAMVLKMEDGSGLLLPIIVCMC